VKFSERIVGVSIEGPDAYLPDESQNFLRWTSQPSLLYKVYHVLFNLQLPSAAKNVAAWK
jgi:hypothetical protein